MKEQEKLKALAIHLKVFTGITLLLTSCLATSCVTTSPKIASREGQEINVVSQKGIIILPPTVRFESIKDESALNPQEYHGGEVEASLISNVSEALRNKSFSVQNSGEVSSQDQEFNTAYQRILDKRNDLFRPAIDNELSQIITNFGKASKYSNVLAIDFKTKIGPRGYWEPMSGGITSGMSYSRIRAALIDTESGIFLWKNEIQLNERPKPGSENLTKAVDVLFQSLKVRKEQ